VILWGRGKKEKKRRERGIRGKGKKEDGSRWKDAQGILQNLDWKHNYVERK
jgi:hypothetical protein